MRFRFDLPNKEIKKFATLALAMRAGAEKGHKKGLYYLEGKIKSTIKGRPVKNGTGKPLQVITGTLKRGVKVYMKTTSNVIRGHVVNRVEYAAVHEYGFPERNIPARPHVSPVLEAEKEINYVEKLIRKEIRLSKYRYRRSNR